MRNALVDERRWGCTAEPSRKDDQTSVCCDLACLGVLLVLGVFIEDPSTVHDNADRHRTLCHHVEARAFLNWSQLMCVEKLKFPRKVQRKEKHVDMVLLLGFALHGAHFPSCPTAATLLAGGFCFLTAQLFSNLLLLAGRPSL